MSPWELPQTLLGHALLRLLRRRGLVLGEEPGPDCLLVETRHIGVSLGEVVFWFRGDGVGPDGRGWCAQHELGHREQSRVFGPLYLLIVGLPSASRAAYAAAHQRRTGRRWTRYFDAWPEDDADRRGGVPPRVDGRVVE